MLYHSVKALLADARISTVFVVLAAADAEFGKHDWSAFGDRIAPLYCGGDTRHDSVLNGLLAASPALQPEDWILVHDAARPCLARDDLRRLLNALARDPVGGLLATPVSDTLKRADDKGCVRNTVDREGLWRAGTPQMFRFGVLRRGLAFCRDRKRPVTDEASAVEALGLRPRLVTGRSDNLKVTTAADAKLAAVILAAQMRKSR